MKKLILTAMLAAFGMTSLSSFSSAYACDGKTHDKSSAGTANKKQEKKAEDVAPKPDQKT